MRLKILGYCLVLIISFSPLLFFRTQAQEGEIALKILGVNPSRVERQKVSLEAHLPKEATPEDVVDLGEFEINYDVERDLYYVFKEVELNPGESISREIILRDIWSVKENDLEPFLARVEELVDDLRESAYHEYALSIREEVEALKEIIFEAQSEAPRQLPHMRVGVYRKNQERIGSIASKIEQLERMLFEHRLILGARDPARLSQERTWAVIGGVVLALGVLSLIFFIIWHKQAGILKSEKPGDFEEI